MSIILNSVVRLLGGNVHSSSFFFFFNYYYREKVTYPLCWENGSKLGKWIKNGPKTACFEFIEIFFIKFCLISSIMQIFIICCVSAKIPHMGKFLFLRYNPKYSQPIRLQDCLINNISRT